MQGTLTKHHNRLDCNFPSISGVMKFEPTLPDIEEESKVLPLDLEESEERLFVAILLLSVLELSHLNKKKSS